MERHLIKEDLKYVIATFTEPISYLHSLHQGSYEFVYDIDKATKTRNKHLATDVANYYKLDTGDNMELVVLPLITSYTLVEE